MSGYGSAGGGLTQAPIGEPGWWQASDGLWYPPSSRPAPPPPTMYQGQPPPYYAPQKTNGMAERSVDVLVCVPVVSASGIGRLPMKALVAGGQSWLVG